MKILRLYTRLPPLPGGMENHIAQLTKEQIHLGHEVVIYFNKGNNVSSNDVQVSKLPLHKLKPQFIGILLFYFCAYIKLLTKRQKFDLIHIHGDWSSLIFSNLIKKIVGAEKIFFSIHDELSSNFFSKKALSLLLGNTDLIFASGYSLASQLNKITKKKIIVQPSGVKTIFFKRIEKVFNHNSFQVITTASLVKKKNLSLVLDIAKALPLVNFIIVGEGPEKKYLLGRINYEDITNVQVLGYKTPDELLVLYQVSDIFMITSLREGTPTAMLEAMACGLPIITSGAGGVKRILEPYNDIVNKNNKESYVASISELIKDVGIMRVTSKHNIERSQLFSWKNIAKKIDRYIIDSFKL